MNNKANAENNKANAEAHGISPPRSDISCFPYLAMIEIHHLLLRILNEPLSWMKLNDNIVLRRQKADVTRDIDLFNNVPNDIEDNSQEDADGEDEDEEQDEDDEASESDPSYEIVSSLDINNTFDYLMNELKDIVLCLQSQQHWPDDRRVSPISSNGVYIFENLISSTLNDRMKAATNAVEYAYNMGLSRNSQEVNLIDPSLYCLVYNRTKWSKTHQVSFGDRSHGIQTIIASC